MPSLLKDPAYCNMHYWDNGRAVLAVGVWPPQLVFMAGLATCLADEVCAAAAAAVSCISSCPFPGFLLPCTWVFQTVQNCSPSWQAAQSAELWGREAGFQVAEGFHVLGQLGSERPAAEEATGKCALAASWGDKAFALSASQRVLMLLQE